jgi:SAM-dependent methyltransferase
MANADEIRTQQRQTWDHASRGWEKWESRVQPMLAPVRDEIISMLGVAADTRHLDVATGTGEPGLTIAALAPAGRVVLTDLSSEMLPAASRAAAARGLTNVEVREASADALPFEDASFDTVSCRFGLMFVPDVAAAVAEMARVLRPGGRLCVAVWAGPTQNPWITTPMGVIGTEVELPVPPPDAPGMFRCAAPGAVAGVLAAAGLRDVREREVEIVQVLADVAEHWEMTNEVSAPIAAAMAGLDDAARARIRAAWDAAFAPFLTADGLRVPGTALCVAGTK